MSHGWWRLKCRARLLFTEGHWLPSVSECNQSLSKVVLKYSMKHSISQKPGRINTSTWITQGNALKIFKTKLFWFLQQLLSKRALIKCENMKKIWSVFAACQTEQDHKKTLNRAQARQEMRRRKLTAAASTFLAIKRLHLCFLRQPQRRNKPAAAFAALLWLWAVLTLNAIGCQGYQFASVTQRIPSKHVLKRE